MHLPGTISKIFSDEFFKIVNTTDVPDSIKQNPKLGIHLFSKRLKERHDKLPALIKSMKQEYVNHFDLTMALNKELALELAKVAAQNYLSTRPK